MSHNFWIYLVNISLSVSLFAMDSRFQGEILDIEGNKIFFNLPKAINESKVINTSSNQKELGEFRKFYLESEKLEYFCRENKTDVYYKSTYDRDEFLRSVISTLQFKMISYSINAIPHYAKALSIDSLQYDILVDNLLNSCSANFTLYSKRLLKSVFQKHYQGSENVLLPYMQRKKMYSEDIAKFQSENEIIVNELFYTSGVFKYACSWGNKEMYHRKLSSLLNSPLVMSYIINEISNIPSFYFSDKLVDKRVAQCQNQVCRPIDKEKNLKTYPKSLGSTDINLDLKVNYCKYFRSSREAYEPGIETEVKKKLSHFEKDNERVIAQFISLITRVPDFSVWTQNTDIIKKYISASNDGLWNYWAKDFLKQKSKRIEYQEALKLSSDSYANNSSPSRNRWPSVSFNITNGEFDIITSTDNMIDMSFDIRIPNKDVKWLHESYKHALLNSDVKKVKELKSRLKNYVDKDYKNIYETLQKFSVNADISQTITDEVMRQLALISSISSDKSKSKINVKFNIAPYAIISIRNRRKLSELSEQDLAFVNTLKRLESLDNMAVNTK